MSAPPSPTLSDSALLDSLEDDPRFDLSAHRERRLEELQREIKKVQTLQTSEYGRVVTYGEEKKLIERMAKEKYCLLNFIHPDFHRCRIMDKRLDELAPKYPHTLFLSTSVSSAPFLVSKFSIQVLPCVLIFVDGRCVDRLIGFEDLGHDDGFSARALEVRLKESGALVSGKITLAGHLDQKLLGGGAGSRGGGNEGEDEEDDDGEEGGRAGNSRGNGLRRGKTGIRDGLASGTRDADEWD
ncbi:putative GTPase inhibitor [Dioszegia hungarica]|uniref:GTPase inhibitor n=1 Tax=Dioszegia hungarica TaxID=4972 RepID=A0AA38LUH5_9TREE|nr:putative GTPase inhibitor [Dioszegia hungarica]KAI9633886.1 putative GTPase inhibitor [Dioszegia hungarica]